MGVRESVAQQPENEMRLHEMTVQETSKKPELLFDVETEITPEEWDMMTNVDCLILPLRSAKVLGVVRILSPERLDKSTIGDLKGRAIKEMDEKIEQTLELGRKGNARNFNDPVAIKLLFPETDFEENNKPFLYRKLQNAIDTNKVEDILRYGFDCAVLFPEDFSFRETIDEDKKGKIEEWAKSYGPTVSVLRMGAWLKNLGRIKVLLPEIFEKVCTKEDSRKIIETTLFNDRNNPAPAVTIGDFAVDALYAGILAAKEVRITKEKGLELIMPSVEEFHEPEIPRPVRREF